MEKNKLLVVYNTCGFSGREPVDWYIDCIKNMDDTVYKFLQCLYTVFMRKSIRCLICYHVERRYTYINMRRKDIGNVLNVHISKRVQVMKMKHYQNATYLQEQNIRIRTEIDVNDDSLSFINFYVSHWVVEGIGCEWEGLG